MMVCQDALNSLSSKIKIQIWLSLKGENSMGVQKGEIMEIAM
jgi:hypothetical protein